MVLKELNVKVPEVQLGDNSILTIQYSRYYGILAIETIDLLKLENLKQLTNK